MSDPNVPTAPKAGRRTLAPTPAPVPAPAVIEAPTDTARVFVETTDEATLTLVHAFNQTGYMVTVQYAADGTKTISV